MAANPIGRMLLYRILIEVLRIDGTGVPCAEIRDRTAYKVRKNKYEPLSLSVEKDDEIKWYFSNITHKLAYSLSPFTVPWVIPVESSDHTYQFVTINVALWERSISLFHELLHWFHCLKNHKRYTAAKKKLFPHTKEPSIYTFYYDSDVTELSPWLNNGKIKGEEMHAILGYNSYTDNETGETVDASEYLAGDELSENLFRAFLCNYCPYEIDENSLPSLLFPNANSRFGHGPRLSELKQRTEIRRALLVLYKSCSTILPRLPRVPTWMKVPGTNEIINVHDFIMAFSDR